EQFQADVTGTPELRGRRGQHRLGQMDEALDQLQWPSAEGQLRSTRRAEEIRDERKVRALDLAEYQRRSVGGNHAAMDLRGLEHGIHRRIDVHHILVLLKLCEKGAEIGEAHGDPRLYPGPEAPTPRTSG